MRFKTVLKRISVFFLVFIVLFCVVFFSFNKAKTVKAVVPIAIGGAAALLFSALAAQGIAFNFSNLDQSGLNNFADDVTNGYSSDGKTWSDWKDDYNNEDGSFNWASLFVSKDSQATSAVVSNEFLKWFQNLPDFVTNKYNLSTSDTVIMDSLYIDTNVGKVLVYDSFASVQNSGAKPASILGTGFGDDTTIEFNSNFKLRYSFFENTSTGNLAYNSWYMINGSSWNFGNSGSATKVDSASVFLYKFISNNVSFIGVGFSYESPYASGRFYTQQNSGFSLPVADIDGSAISVSGGLADGYQDLQDALDQELQDKVTAGYGDTAVGVIDLGNVDGVTADQKIDNLTRKIIATGTVAGTGVGVWDNEGTYEEEEEQNKVPTAGQLDNNIVLVNGLEDLFPFCIPFDLFEIIDLLNVPAEAPKFNWKMSFAGRVDDYDILIDLTPYNTVAAVFRTMIIIVFLIFLTLKTRDLIRG